MKKEETDSELGKRILVNPKNLVVTIMTSEGAMQTLE